MANKPLSTTLGNIAAPGDHGFVDGPFGSNLPASAYTPFGIPVIRGSNLTLGDTRFRSDVFVFVSEDTAARLSRSTCKPLDIVFTKKGTIGQTGLIPSNGKYDRYLLSSNQMKLTVDPQKADPLFVYYFVSSPASREKVLRDSEATGVPKTNLTYFRNFPIRLPSLGDQQRIADILGTLDDKIELNRRMNETLEAMARRLFKSWFIDFDPVHAKAALRREHPKLSNADLSRRALPNMAPEIAELFPDSFEDSTLGLIPKEWNAGTVPDAIEVNPTCSLAKGTVAPWLEMSNMPTRSARALGWENREFGSGTKFINGDTLVARITPCLENGKTAFVDFLNDGQVGAGSTEYIILRPKAPLPPVFAYLLARTDDFRQHLIANMTGTSGRQRAPAECLNKFPLVTPPKEIANRFGEAVENLFAQMKTTDEESLALTAARDKLLPPLLSGELHAQREVT